MRRFTVPRSQYSHWYVPDSRYLIEMKPRWVDDATLQLAISTELEAQWNRPDAATMARRVKLKATCPGLADPLKWCAAKRMGVKIVTVEGIDLPEDLATEIKNHHDGGSPGISLYTRLQGISDVRGDSQGNLHVHTFKPKIFGHRLVFKDVNHALEFKLAWF
jgi:hypothetical protein